MDNLPSEFDIVILGTGLTETIVAAAFSRIGLKVLHLDRNGYYGGSSANFSLQGYEEWEKDFDVSKENSERSEEEILKLLVDGETFTPLPANNAHAHHIKSQFNVRHRTAEEIEAAKALKAGKITRLNAPLEVDYEISSCVAEDGESRKEETVISCQNTEIKCGEERVLADTETALMDNNDKNKNQEPADTSYSNSTKDSTIEYNKPEISSQSSVQPNLAEDSGKEEARDVAKEENKEDKTDTDKTIDQSSSAPGVVKKEWTVEGIQEEGRRFCFDLSPRVLYCSGDLVELLIRSDVSRYCEFRTVSRVLTFLKGSLGQVPCSRADVFSSKIVSLIEKRLMMKFLKFASDFESSPDEYMDFISKPFHEFLSSKKLSANVKNFVQNAIAMVNDKATTEEGLRKTQIFLRSLGRYGNTAFLFPLYGSGELPQAFSRLSAVFGGIYCLMLSASYIIIDQEKKCSGIITSSGQKIACRYVVGEVSYLPSSFVQVHGNRTTSRAILITDKSISPSDDDELSLLNFVCEVDSQRPVTVLELPNSASVCPKGVFIVHLTRESTPEGDAESDFTEVKDKLFGDGQDESKPKILWHSYFTQSNLSQVSLSENAVENVLVTSAGGDNVVDLERIVDEAKTIFHKVCPNEEFLAKPPNPEDIILVDDEEKSVLAGKSADDDDDETEVEKEEQKDDKSMLEEIPPSEKSDPKESTDVPEEHEKVEDVQ